MSNNATKFSNINVEEDNDEEYTRKPYIKYVQRPSTTAKNKRMHSKSTQKSGLKLPMNQPHHFQTYKYAYQSLYDHLSKNPTDRKSVATNTPHQRKHVQQQDKQIVALMNVKQNLRKLWMMDKSSNQMMKELLTHDIVSDIRNCDPIFHKLNEHLTESIVLISKFELYEPSEQIQVSQTDSVIGFLIYGKVKLFNKTYKNFIERGQTFGEHHLYNVQVDLKCKAVEESCFLWLPVKYYRMLRQESIKNGLKADANQLQILLRLNFIKKKLKEHSKKMHI